MSVAAALSAPASWSKACARCGRSYGPAPVPVAPAHSSPSSSSAPWESLELVFTVPPSGVQQHLSVPAQWRVEVRRCACGAMLAARG